LLSPYQPGKGEAIRCVAGECVAPPEKTAGPLRFRKMLHAIEWGSEMEKQAALDELGPEFIHGLFDMDKCNRKINTSFSVDTK
jgi:hypothetical protein